MFYNLTAYDSHHIMQKIHMLGEKINVIPNGLEKKYVAFMSGKNLC